MKAEGYVQIVPSRNSRGRVSKLRLEGVTRNYPQRPIAGALVAKVAIEVDEAVFGTPEIQVSLEAEDTHIVPVLTPVTQDDEAEDESVE